MGVQSVYPFEKRGNMEHHEQALEPVEQENIAFHGQNIVAVRLADGRICVILRWVCESLRLQPGGQVRRIERTASTADELVRVKVQTPGGKQTMPAITLKGFPVWILTISPGEVEDEQLKELIIAYQTEAKDALYKYFINKRRFVLPESQAVIPAEPIKPDVPQPEASSDIWIKYHQQMIQWYQWKQNMEARVQKVEQRQDNTEARVGKLEKIVDSILPHVGGLSSAHRATAKEMVDQISKISGTAHRYIWSDLNKVFHVAAYSDIQDEKWAEVQKWLQQRLDTAKRGKGVEQQPTLFDEKSENR
jgi:P22_AR N-terminal domain